MTTQDEFNSQSMDFGRRPPLRKKELGQLRSSRRRHFSCFFGPRSKPKRTVALASRLEVPQTRQPASPPKFATVGPAGLGWRGAPRREKILLFGVSHHQRRTSCRHSRSKAATQRNSAPPFIFLAHSHYFCPLLCCFVRCLLHLLRALVFTCSSTPLYPHRRRDYDSPER